MTGEEVHALENLIQGVIVSTTFVLLAFSPIAKAIGKRIMHGRLPVPGAPPLDDPRMDQISGEMAALRHHLDDTLERLDFAERMIARTRERGVLNPGKEG